MASVQTGIEMQDQFSSVLMSFINHMTAAVTAANSFLDVMNQSINTGGLSSVRSEIQSVAEELNALNQSAELPISPTISEEVQSVQQFNEQIEQTQGLLQRVLNIQQQLNTESQKFDVLLDDVQVKIQGLNNSIFEMQAAMNQVSQNPFDIPTEAVEAELASLQNRIRKIIQEQLVLNETLSHMDVEIEQPPPVQIPVEWQTDNLDVFTSTGVERFSQEIQSANAMLEQLSNTQNEIARQAFNTNVLPPSAFRNMNSLATRIDLIKKRIQQIENKPLNMNTDRANSELEQLRSQLSQAIVQQNEMNSAIDRMDVQSANSAYLRLSQTISGTERYIRDNINEQENFNNKIAQGASKAQSFVKTLMGSSVVQSAIGLVKGQMDSAISRMDTMTNYNRTMTAITGSSELASASLEKLKEVTNGTAYGLDVAASGVQNFVTRGMDISNAVNEVGNWADAVSFYGDGTDETLSTVTDALGKMLSKGTVEMEQLNRLTDSGIDAVGIYAQATGKAVSNVQTSLSEGKISSQEFITTVSSAFENGTNGVLNISGAAKDAGATWETSIANAKAAVTRGIIDIIDNINQSLSNAGFGTILDGIKEFGVQAENVLAKLGTFAGAVITKVAPLVNKVVGIFSSITDSAGISLDSLLDKITGFVGMAVTLLEPIVSFVGTIASFVVNNWSMISPIVYGIVAALIAYYTIMGIVSAVELVSKGIKMAMCIAEYAHAAAKGTAVAATTAETAAQLGLNTALLACPLTWIILLIIALIAVVIAVANYIAKMGGTATTAFGVITGGVNVVIQFFKNLGLLVANIALGIGNAIVAVASNIMTAFGNAIKSVQSWWYGLLSTVLTVVAGICEALNKLPFVEFDYSGISNAANEYATKSAEAANSKGNYRSVGDAFNDGMSTFDAFRSGWASDAYKAGAKWGDGISDKVSKAVKGIKNDTTNQGKNPNDIANSGNRASEIAKNQGKNPNDIASSGNRASEIAKNTGDTAKTAQKSAQSLDISGENLKYVKDMAERDYINRFTTAKINVKQTNHNKVNNNMDLDGINEYLRSDLEQRMAATAEGVH